MENQNHYILRVGDGKNFKNSSNHKVWAINSRNKTFLGNVKEGDILWFVRNKTTDDTYTGRILAVAEFSSKNNRITGPLISTFTNSELGWDDAGEYCDIEINYKNMRVLLNKNLYTGQHGQTTVISYNNVKEKLFIDLEKHYYFMCVYENTQTSF